MKYNYLNADARFDIGIHSGGTGPLPPHCGMTAEYSGYRPLRRFKDCLNDPAAIRKANGRGGRKRNDLNGRLLSKEKRDLRRVRFSAGRTPTACLTAGS
jgi:hypothetical protein